MLTAWLEHPEFGANKLLATVGRENAKGGKDKAPKKVEIYNDVDFDIAKISGVDPPSVPSLVVISDLDLRGTDAGQIKKSGFEMAAIAGVGYYAEDGYRSDNVRDGNYVLRAVMKSFRRLNAEPTKNLDFRELNGVSLARMTGLTMQRVGGAVPPSRLLGMVFTDWMILDKAP